MVLQLALKVSVFDASAYSSSATIGPSLTSSPEKLASMSIGRSSTHVTPPEAPFLVANLRHEEALLEIVRYSEETLAVSTKRRLLERVSMGIPLVGLGSSPLQSK